MVEHDSNPDVAIFPPQSGIFCIAVGIVNCQSGSALNDIMKQTTTLFAPGISENLMKATTPLIEQWDKLLRYESPSVDVKWLSGLEHH